MTKDKPTKGYTGFNATQLKTCGLTTQTVFGAPAVFSVCSVSQWASTKIAMAAFTSRVSFRPLRFRRLMTRGFRSVSLSSSIKWAKLIAALSAGGVAASA